MTIKVFEKTPGCLPEIIEKGDWIDLKVSQDVVLKTPFAATLHRKRKDVGEERVRMVSFDSTLLPLGIAMQLPKGYEAYLVVRSSSFKKWGIVQTNSMGIIDNTYSSEKDEWKLPVLATRYVTIPKGTRIAQFRIQLSQKATIWQRIKWLFTNSIKIEKVEHLDNEERSGFGSTGEK